MTDGCWELCFLLVGVLPNHRSATFVCDDFTSALLRWNVKASFVPIYIKHWDLEELIPWKKWGNGRLLKVNKLVNRTWCEEHFTCIRLEVNQIWKCLPLNLLSEDRISRFGTQHFSFDRFLVKDRRPWKTRLQSLSREITRAVRTNAAAQLVSVARWKEKTHSGNFTFANVNSGGWDDELKGSIKSKHRLKLGDTQISKLSSCIWVLLKYVVGSHILYIIRLSFGMEHD